MATIRCLRSAFDACRPQTASRIQQNHSLVKLSTQRSIPKRTYADASERSSSKTKAKSFAKQDRKEASSSPLVSSEQGSGASSIQVAKETPNPGAIDKAIQEPTSTVTEPRPVTANVLAAYHAPLKHRPQYGVPVASLQLRSYSVRSLEYFADFALRAAYYLNLPATGPVPLPKRRERWTVIKSNFVHKKTQENFERITYKRLITIMDGEKSAVEVWLAALRKWQFYGVGMKANVWEWEGVDVASKMDAQAKDIEAEIDAKLALFGWNKEAAETKSVRDLSEKQGVKATGVPMTEVREGSQHRASQI